MHPHLFKLLNNHYIKHFPVENMCLDNLSVLRGEFSIDNEKSSVMQNTNNEQKNINTNHYEVRTKRRLSDGYNSSYDSQLSSNNIFF